MIILPMLQSASGALADTVATAPVRDAFDLVFAVAAGSLALAMIGLLFLLGFSFAQFRRGTQALEETAKRVASDPGVESLRKAAANLESISGMATDEAEKLRASISQLSDRLTQASDRMEERIEEFNALMEVVQSEVEEVFVDTASTARGVRAGVSKLSEPTPPARIESQEDE